MTLFLEMRPIHIHPLHGVSRHTLPQVNYSYVTPSV